MPESTTIHLLVDLKSGRTLGTDETGAKSYQQAPVPQQEALEDFAAVAPELFCSTNISWDALFASLDAAPDDLEFKDIVLVGGSRIYVAQRFASDSGLVHLSVSPIEKGIGLALSEARNGSLQCLQPR